MSEINESMKGWAFVTSVANQQEAVMVESMLGAEGIPVQQKHKEAGGIMEVYMGMSHYGIDLFVPEDALDVAKAILDSEVIDMPEEVGIEEDIKASEKYEHKRKGIVRVILMYLFIPIVAAILWNIIYR